MSKNSKKGGGGAAAAAAAATSSGADDVTVKLVKLIKKADADSVRDLLIKKFGTLNATGIAKLVDPTGGHLPLLTIAIRSGADNVAKLLLDEAYVPPGEALLEAVRLDDDVCCRLLVEHALRDEKKSKSLLGVTNSKTKHNLFHMLAHSGSPGLVDFFLRSVFQRDAAAFLLEMLVFAVDSSGDSPLQLAASLSPDMLNEAVLRIAELAEASSASSAAAAAAASSAEEEGDSSPTSEHFTPELRSKIAATLAPVLLQLLSFSEISARVVSIFDCCISRLAVNPAAPLPVSDAGATTTLIHAAIEAAGRNQRSLALLPDLLRVMLFNNSISNSNSDKKDTFQSGRGLKWMHELKDNEGEADDDARTSILELAISCAVGEAAMTELLSCEDPSGAAKKQSLEQHKALSEAAGQLLLDSMNGLLDDEEAEGADADTHTQLEAEAWMAARLSTARAFSKAGILSPAELLRLEANSKEVLAEFGGLLEQRNTMEKEQKQKQQQEAAAAAAAGNDGGDYSGTGSTMSAAERARQAALKQGAAKKAAAQRRAEKANAKAASNSGDDDDDGEAKPQGDEDGDDGNDADAEESSSRPKPKPKKKLARKKRRVDEGANLADVLDEEDDNNKAAASSTASDSDAEAQKEVHPNDPTANHSTTEKIILLLFVIAFVILFFFLSG